MRRYYYEAAFEATIPDAEKPERWYLCLISSYQRYGGPEEGGWWQTMSTVEKYKVYASMDLAYEAKAQMEALAVMLTDMGRREYGDMCLRQMEMLDRKGLDADYLPIDDGPSVYYIAVCEELPIYETEPSHYE